tara:strand:- start:122 stop:292 length:171 start_codon:yes stop_codon:yes gene_type:complete
MKQKHNELIEKMIDLFCEANNLTLPARVDLKQIVEAAVLAGKCSAMDESMKIMGEL